MNNLVGSTSRAEKIRDRHLDRLALVYVRQSSLRQVQQHQESTKLQYGLAERAITLGWPREQVVVIDEDQGKSGASAEGRLGFQRLVADVGLGKVGIVLGIDMSRLARSCTDWYQLLEICAVFGTLIADVDGLYDPGIFNDRLLLGLKGTMSEAELHTIRQRLYSGKRAKAERGDMAQLLPFGFVRRPSGEVVQDPDEQARSVISLIFDAFRREGSVHGLLRYLVKQNVRLPVRNRSGLSKGELAWRPVCRASLHNMMRNPAYAGAYAWGRRSSDPRRMAAGKARKGITTLAQDQWAVCLQDRLPAYISWSQYEDNLAKIKSNRSIARGAPREGDALLTGLVRCGKCGRRMGSQYSGLDSRPRYHCMAETRQRLGPTCQSLCATELDRMVEELVLQAVQPAALQVSLGVAADLDAQRQQLDRHWRQRIEQATYHADRARRQYVAVEPENRLVARQLERDWNEALAERAKLQDEFERYKTAQPAALTAAERAEIAGIAQDLPRLWSAPTTTMIDRKTIIGLLIDKVVVAVQGVSEHVAIVVHWQGGHQTQAELRRPMRFAKNMSRRKELSTRTVALQNESMTAEQISEQLNREGFQNPRGGPVTSNRVYKVLRELNLTGKNRRSERRVAHDQLPDEVPLREAARRIGMPFETLRIWIDNGKAKGRVARTFGNRIVLVTLDEQELQRLQELRRQPARGRLGQ